MHYNYANLLKHARRDYESSERHYRRAIQLDENHADALGNLANLLADVHNKYDDAESFYRRAVRVDPKHADNIGNYADFMAGKYEHRFVPENNSQYTFLTPAFFLPF